MPPRRRAPTPIPIDIEAVRRKVAEGKIVRVGISRSAQFPEGGTGRVRHVGDPAVDGEEYVQVELSLNGTRDILPFTPADLTPATRAKAGSSTGTASATPVATPKAPLPPRPSTLSSGQAAPVMPSPGNTPTPTVTVGTSSGGTSALAGAGTDSSAPSSGAAGEGSAASRASAATTRVKGSRGQRRSHPVSITIATTDTEPTQWRIEARVGARVVLRSGSVSPARVWELVQQLADPTLINAVGGILDEQRKIAQSRADELAAELAQVRAELAALPRHQ